MKNPWKVTTVVLASLLLLVVGASPPEALGAQVRMETALKAMKAAKKKLEAATPDKGGHRVKAMGLLDQSIAEVEAGIAFDKEHQSKEEKAKAK